MIVRLNNTKNENKNRNKKREYEIKEECSKIKKERCPIKKKIRRKRSLKRKQ